MKFPPDLKLITFDLDDTLWPCMPVILHAENVLYSWLGQHAPRLAAEHSVESIREHRKSIATERPDIAYNLRLTRLMSLQRLLDQHGYRAELAEQAVQIFQIARNKVTPYDDVAPVLKLLGQTFHLIAVTNGNADIAQTPLNGYFSHALTAEMVGASKPDPAMFIEAMRLAKVEPAQTLHVGDDPTTDVDAAHQAGIHSIWLNRFQHTWPVELLPAHYEINQLDQLLHLLTD